MGKAQREIFIELPPEDAECPGDTEPMIGRLLRSMYGTQDAAHIWEADWQQWLKANGGEFSPLCPALFKVPERGIIGLVHGDDFAAVGSEEDLAWLNGVLNERYTARWEATIGGDEEGSAFFLNRLIRYKPDGADAGGERFEIEADARHADILINAFGFNDKTKGIDTPEEKLTDKEFVEELKQPVLDDEQTSQYRSMVMRLAYMSTDRPDLAHTVKRLASAMKGPKANDWARLKRAVRYLIKVRYMKRVFKRQEDHERRVIAFSDSDWAGEIKTRRSTTGSVVKLGGHTLLAKCATQKVVALSSAESEFYGMCRTATLAEFVRGILEFWGAKVNQTELKADSSAAKAMAERRGVGKTRHIQARYLWLQDKVSEKVLKVTKVDGKKNDSDLMTKVQPRSVMKEHLERMGFEMATRDGHKNVQ